MRRARAARSSLRSCACAAAIVAACGCGGAEARRARPAATGSNARPADGQDAKQASRAGLPPACDQPWNLEVIGGDGRVVVVCSHDVRRQALDELGPAAGALFPALDPARDKVCGCVAGGKAPGFVDLVFTAKPEDGQVTVQASGDDDLDPDLGPALVQCIGTLAASFPPTASNLCEGGGKAVLIYPVRLDLAP
ncbi:MAG TPA: hypothetical protein VE987_11815 [Polyangiaceae bacterium]|nr:hypothetical protein [Polyangiaceae bacterium]